MVHNKHIPTVGLRLIALILLLTATPLRAQEGDAAILQHIYETNRRVASLQSTYTHIRTNAFGHESRRLGNIYFVDSTNQLALIGTNPKGKDFITSEGRLHHSIAPITMNVKLKNSSLMRALTHNMLWAVHGEVQKIIDDNTVDVTISTEGGYYVIRMEARSGFNRGISSIVLKYDTHRCLLQYMEMKEAIHVSHVFELGSEVRLNHPIAPEIFKW